MFLKPAFCAVLAAAAIVPSYAASDYFLKLDGVKGEAASTIEVLSWSWGTSNAGSMSQGSGMGSGKASKASASSSAEATGVSGPRESGSGMASGRRSIGPDMEPDLLTLNLPAGSKLCAQGQHIKDAVLTGKGNTRIHLQDVMVTSCRTTGATAKAELKGHVTLIK